MDQVTFEVEQIDHLLAAYADLLEPDRAGTPGLIEITAAASVLHSFYNGVEAFLDSYRTERSDEQV